MVYTGGEIMSKKTTKDWQTFRDELNTTENVEPDTAQLDDLTDNSEIGVLDHPSYIELEKKLTLAEQLSHQRWEELVRATAEVENIRRRAERDVSNAHRYGANELLKAFLPVLDSLDQALQLAEQDQNVNMHEGLELTMKLFLGVMEKAGVSRLYPLGELFDPQQQEAMSAQDSAEHTPNTVIHVLQPGYILHDRVIRPARVIVSKQK